MKRLVIVLLGLMLLYSCGPLTEEESNSLEFHYKWREQTHMIQALINDIRSKL